ncbi:MAG: UvrD-helicase domain-containing protein [Salinivirgaceae bacterium]
MTTKPEKFDANTVPLQGKNLIEASAGTGKTFSIALLVLRMLIEKEIPLRKILMVTFTKAAVAELENRVRKFIREAFQYTQTGKADKQIGKIVKNGIELKGKDKVVNLLKAARMELDQTSIFTIHSFCQQSLNEFAFETGQLFNSEVVEDQSALVEKVVNEFWRQHITTLDFDVLQLLDANGLSRGEMLLVVNKSLSGKKFACDATSSLAELYDQYKVMPEEIEQAAETFEKAYNATDEKNNRKDKTVSRVLNAKIDTVEKFRDKLCNKKHEERFVPLFPQLLPLAQAYHELKAKKKAIPTQMIHLLYHQAAELAKKEILDLKHKLSLFSFDDLISGMYNALADDSKSKKDLIRVLQQKYAAAFIDEFQDTDYKQYQIFSTLFKKDRIVFYIGDPKQSIYRFRGADIDTYKAATADVNHIYTMDQNYRSTHALVEAMNDFYSPVTNAFQDEEIRYEEVSSGKNEEEIKREGKEELPISLINCKIADEIVEQVACRVHALLTQNYTIYNRAIKPSDIGILTKSKIKAKEIKRALNAMGIPAITIDETKVFETTEATQIRYILQAIMEPNKNNVNRALYGSFTAKTTADLLDSTDESDINHFVELRQLWNEKDVYSALQKFLRIYGVNQHIFATYPNNAGRMISNYLQITELLHKKEVQAQVSQQELINWMVKQATESESSNEFVQRLENDEDAVQIVTIHKSKGLAYNIVFAPTLDLQTQNRFSTYDYKNPETGETCFALKSEKGQTLTWYKEQAEQENRRLMYVALTRAVFKCYIFHNEYYKNRGSLIPFLKIVEQQQGIAIEDLMEKPQNAYSPQPQKTVKKIRTFEGKVLTPWQFTSFSALSHAHGYTQAEKVNNENAYNRFVFEQMPKGATAGNFLHELFENTDFTSTDFADFVEKAGRKHPKIYNPEHKPLYEQLIDHTLHAQMPIDEFTLSQLAIKDKLPEMEFYFHIEQLRTRRLSKLLQAEGIKSFGPIDGLMHGFIDLVFRHRGKYFILDWKSNYLGSNLADYTQDKLTDAMHASNYHLQYLVYTVALVRYLKQHIPNFNYANHFGGAIYVFLRGCRKDQSTGIFFDKPGERLVEELEGVFMGDVPAN